MGTVIRSLSMQCTNASPFIPGTTKSVASWPGPLRLHWLIHGKRPSLRRHPKSSRISTLIMSSVKKRRVTANQKPLSKARGDTRRASQPTHPKSRLNPCENAPCIRSPETCLSSKNGSALRLVSKPMRTSHTATRSVSRKWRQELIRSTISRFCSLNGRVEWAREDALPFTLCVSSIGPAPECEPLTDGSVARGNVILVDHGATQPPEQFQVPDAIELPAGCLGALEPRETILKSRAFPVTLKYGPLTYRSPYPAKDDLARTQLKFLAGFMSSVRRHVERLWQQVKDGETLSQDSIAGLEIIFGRKTLIANLATASRR